MNATAESRSTQALAPVPSFGVNGLLVGAVMAVSLVVVFSSGLILMVQWWMNSEEYSYGWFVPPIAAFLVWQRHEALRALPFTGSWAGVALVAVALAIGVLGELSALYTMIQYAFLLALAGAVLSLTGWRAFRVIAVALLTLLLMVPLPSFIYFPLSQQLQLCRSMATQGHYTIILTGADFLSGVCVHRWSLSIIEAPFMGANGLNSPLRHGMEKKGGMQILT